jgi:hypothetical protein
VVHGFDHRGLKTFDRWGRPSMTANPERFVKGRSRPPEIPTAVWINKPREVTAP